MSKENKEKKEESVSETQKLMCGIVMPISEIDGCNELHWKEVYTIVSQSIDIAGFDFNLVSNSDDVGVIQKRIIQNLYDNPMVVVDVSGKNPNVMLELGIRLAFDKPTIIIKDDKTKYSFDTSPIEHLEYPRDLRFSKIVEFKQRLADKILQTHKKATTDENFSTFLKHFGSFKVAQIETEVVSKEDYILEEIKNLREIVVRSTRNSQRRMVDYERPTSEHEENIINICLKDKKLVEVEAILNEIKTLRGITFSEIEELNDEHFHITLKISENMSKRMIIRKIETLTNGSCNFIR